MEPVASASGHELTDLGNARRLVERYGEDLRFVHDGRGGYWLGWDGKRWAQDNSEAVVRLAKQSIDAFLVAARQADPTGRSPACKFGLQSQSEGAISKAIKLARSEPGIPVPLNMLDANPFLLNASNGTLELRTGMLGPHNRTDLITRLAPVDFRPDAQAPTWTRFLDVSLEGNVDLIRFLARALGYALTASVEEQVFFMVHGPGANGKSTLLEAVRDVMGDYALSTSSETFLAKSANTGANNDVARLRGARFVSAVEAEDGRRLSIVQLKQLTGGDTIVARFLYGEFHEFKPVCKVFFALNHLPAIGSGDFALWRRLRLIPFHFQVPEAQRDKNLAAKLRAESEGILAWLVEGCREWQRNGLGEPPAVQQATADYREQEDVFARFIAERCVRDARATTPSAALLAAFNAWAREHGYEAISPKALANLAKQAGLAPVKHALWRGWMGIKLGSTNLADDA